MAGFPPAIVGEDRPIDGSAPAGPELFDLDELDGSTWCSPIRGDCIELRLPDVIGFGGRPTRTWRPTAADPDGCYRSHAGHSDIWYSPPAHVGDIAAPAPRIALAAYRPKPLRYRAWVDLG